MGVTLYVITVDCKVVQLFYYSNSGRFLSVSSEFPLLETIKSNNSTNRKRGMQAGDSTKQIPVGQRARIIHHYVKSRHKKTASVNTNRHLK